VYLVGEDLTEASRQGGSGLLDAAPGNGQIGGESKKDCIENGTETDFGIRAVRQCTEPKALSC